MRRIEFYELNKREMMALGDHMEIRSFDYPSLQRLPTMEAAVDMTISVQREQVPIHHICEMGRPDRFVAMSPQLRGVLSLPFEQELRELREAKERERYAATDFSMRIDAFNKLPLHRRVWRVLRRMAV